MKGTLSLCFLLSALGVLAQDQTPPPPALEALTLEELMTVRITVTGDRLEEPVSQKSDAITVITREEIRAHQWRFVNEALRQVPGLALVQSGSPGKVTSVFLRGAAASQVLVLIDGVPVNNPYAGGTNFEDLTTDGVERIEVLRGPQSPLYGSDSIAGVIHVITLKGSSGTHFEASFEGGSFSTFREKAALHGAAGGRFRYALSLGRQDTGGQGEHDGYGENALAASGSYRFSDRTTLGATAQVYDSQLEIPFHFASDPVTFETFIEPSPLQAQESSLALIGVNLQHASGRYVGLSGRLSYARRDATYEDPGTFSPLIRSESDVFQVSLQNDARLGSYDTLTAGYEFEHQAIGANDQNAPFLDQGIENHALFLQNKLERGRWILTTGVRWDHYNTFGDTVNPRISVACRVLGQSKVRGSFGTGFRAPTASDLAYPGFGNPDLKPEKSRSWEVGYDHYWGKDLLLSASWFHNDYDDLITFDPLTFIAGNVGEARTRGLELSALWRHARWDLTGNYTYLDAKDETTDRRLFRRPEHMGSVRLAYAGARWGAGIHLSAAGDRLETDFLSFENVLNRGYGLLGFTGHYRIRDSVMVFARVANLADKEYEEVLHYRGLGRGFYAGIELEL